MDPAPGACMIHTKIHLMSPGYPQPSIALQNCSLKHNSFHFLSAYWLHLLLYFTFQPVFLSKSDAV